MRGRTITILVGALALSLVLTGAAHANQKRFHDSDDAPGVLDIARVAHGHRTTSSGARHLVHTLKFVKAWPVKKLGRAGFAVVYFELPGHRDNPPERTLQIEYEDGKLVARMFATLGDPPDHLGPVTMWRPNWRTIKVSFPKSLLRKGLKRYKWNAVSFVERKRGMCGRRGGCTDWAPSMADDQRYIRHVL
jgi:hypothetical protein